MRSDQLSKKATMKLRQRIRTNFTMNGNYLRTYPNHYGKPIFDEGVAEGKSMLPVIVVKKYVGRPKKGHKVNKPDRIYEPQALLTYINRYTEFRRKKDAVMRYKKDGAKYVWTTKENLYRASKMEEQRAGNNIFGWNSLAEKVGSAAMRRTLNLTGGNFDKPGGTASIAPATYSPVDSIKINAQDFNTPSQKVSYNQAVIDNNIPKWVNDAFSKELKYMTPAKLLKGVPIPPDVKIWFN